MSARGALTIVGTVVGSYLGGPVGGAIGGMIGGAIGGAIDGPVHSSQQILEDLGALKLDYGSTWARLHGRYRFKISPLWSSEKRPIAHDESVDAKGGPSAVNTSYTYVQDWMCWAPLNAIGWARIWRNGELIATRLAESDADSISASASTTAWSSVTFFDGAADQMPWSVYESAVGTSNASGYRRRPLLCFESLDLGNSGQAPLIEAEFYTLGEAGPALTRLSVSGDNDSPKTDASAYANGDGVDTAGVVDTGGVTVATGSGDGEFYGRTWTPSNGSFDRAAGQVWLIEGYVTLEEQPNASFTELLTYGWGGTTAHSLGAAGPTGAFAYDSPGTPGIDYNSGPPILSVRSHFVIQQGATELRVYLAGQLRHTVASTPSSTTGSPYVRMGVRSAGGTPVSARFEAVRLRFAEDYTGSSFTPPDPIPGPDGDTVDPQPVDLADVVRSEALLEWTGEEGALTADDIDVSDLEGIPVTGVGFTGSPRESIAALADVYYFGAVCSDKLYFRRRGAASAATIPFDDTGRGVGNAAEPFCGLQRGNDVEVAQQVAFTCPGLLRDYEPDTQNSDRLVGESLELRRYQSPVVFEPAEAKGRADTMVYDARIAAHTGKLSLGDEYLTLEPTDVVTAFDQEGNGYRLRIERETYADNAREFDVALDDPNALLSSGITAETDQRAISVAPPASTELILLDTRLLRDADDVPGHYTVMVGRGRWPGGVAYRAPTETGTYARQTAITTSAVAGVATTALPDFAGGNVFDESSVVRVEISGGTLASASREDLIADASVNAFAIGAHGRWEIVQATTPTLVSPGVYDLSGLLRARLGTEYAMSSHEAGDVVVKLQAAGIRSIEDQVAEIGATRFWKGVTLGATLDSATAQEFTAQSERLKPPAPVDLRCSRDASGGFAITAARRSRYAATLFSTPPLGEATEAYEVDILDGGDVVRTIAASSFPVPYNAAQQIADFGSVQAAIDVAVYQLSATVGRGYPLTGTLSTSYTPATQSNTITLAGTFAPGVPISVYANGVLIGSRTSVGGDTDLAGVASALAAVLDAHASYSASAVGSVITIQGAPGATYTLTAIVGGSSAISVLKTQEAAVANPGTSFRAELYVSNLSTGITDPVPAGVNFRVTVKQDGVTVASFNYTTTASMAKSSALAGLIGAFGDDATLADAGYSMNIDSSTVGGYFAVLSGPVGAEGISLTTTATSPWALSVSVQSEGSPAVAENQAQIVRVTVSGTPANGEVFRVTLGGENFNYTAVVPSDTREEVIDGLVAAIDADADYSAVQVSASKFEATGAVIGDYSYTAGITRGITATVA